MNRVSKPLSLVLVLLATATAVGAAPRNLRGVVLLEGA